MGVMSGAVGMERRGGGGATSLLIEGRTEGAGGGGTPRPPSDGSSGASLSITFEATVDIVRTSPGHGENVVVTAPISVEGPAGAQSWMCCDGMQATLAAAGLSLRSDS